MMNRFKYVLLLFLVLPLGISAQKKTMVFDHVEPPYWWTGMKHKSVQVLFHNSKTDLSSFTPEVNYPGVTLREVKKVENNHYLFLTLEIAASAKAGKIPVIFRQGKKALTYTYEIRDKSAETNRIQGFSSKDVVYLIMPDRFANGDPSNDSIPGMFEGANRAKPGARHGGDIKGIADHLDYVKELGVTAVWLNPVLENNQRNASYHGYAITDLYKVDRRFGTNEDYVNLVNQCHASGLKVIQDMVINHIGNEHWLMHDLPEKHWIHQFPEFTRSNYRSTVLSDPYRSAIDEKLMNEGWFDTTMPDVNQSNELFGTYLIQNTLWWIEHAGIDGIRMDTYPYPEKHFMAKWAKTIMEEYPTFNLVGEVWINSVATSAYWQKDMTNQDGYKSNLPSVTDFPLFFALPEALNEEGGWDNGLTKLYNLLTHDYVYPNPNNNLVFVDNHDLTRFYTSVKGDYNKYKMGLAFLLTTRGVPQLYYGSEILMDGDGGHHPNVRKDFPGGWKGDKMNAFMTSGRTKEQNDAFNFMKNLLNWRKTASVIHDGKLTHYIPEENVYVYFRYNDQKTVMVIMNGSKGEKGITRKRYAENIREFRKGKDVITGAEFNLENISIPAQTTLVLELF